MSDLLPARLLSDDDRETLTRWPTGCGEHITRRRRGEVAYSGPCGRLAVAARFSTTTDGVYPVCSQHTGGEMVSLADLLEVADLWAKDQA